MIQKTINLTELVMLDMAKEIIIESYRRQDYALMIEYINKYNEIKNYRSVM